MLEEVLLVVQVALSLIGELLPAIGQGSASAAAKIVASLTQLVPIVIKLLPNMIAPIQDIINALQSTGPLTADQMTSLATMSANLDAALVAAGTADGLTDPLTPPVTPAP
jgi:hypothetical protein